MCDNTCDDDMMSLCANGKESGEDTDAEKGVPYGVCVRQSVCERRCESSRELRESTGWATDRARATGQLLQAGG